MKIEVSVSQKEMHQHIDLSSFSIAMLEYSEGTDPKQYGDVTPLRI